MHYKKNLLKLLIPFLLWPFGVFLFATQFFDRKEGRVIIYLFLILFGLTFVLGNDNLDSYRYVMDFQEMRYTSFSEFTKLFSNFLQTEKTLDIAKPILNFVVSRFTDDYRFLFGTVAAIFGFFYLKSIKIVYFDYIQNKHFNTFLFLLFFAFIINPIFNINGYRFWTSAWIYFYGATLFITTYKRKYLFVSVISIFFHFSFFLPVLILFLFKIIGRRDKLFFSFFIISFFVADIIFPLIPEILSSFGGGIEARAGRYANLEQIHKSAEQLEWAKEKNKWYLFIPAKLTFYYILFSFLYIKRKFKSVISSDLRNLYSFGLLFISVFNMVSFIPTVSRFRTVFLLFAITFLLKAFAETHEKKIHWLGLVGILPFVLNLIVVIRLGLDIINPWLFTILPILFSYNDTSLYQMLF